MSRSPSDAVRRRIRLGILGLGVAVAALSVAVVVEPAVLTGTTRRAVKATAAAYGTTPDVAFVTLHAPLLFGVLAGAVGSVFAGVLGVSDRASLATDIRVAAEGGLLATGVALGVPVAVVVTGEAGGAVPLTLLVAFVAGLPLGVVALGGATVGAALAARTGWRGAGLLGTVGPAAGVVFAHVAPTGPVWTVSLGATFVGMAALGGGWSMLVRDR